MGQRVDRRSGRALSWRRRSLRSRVQLAFGVLALAISLVLSVLSWIAVSQYLLTQRESLAVTETDLDRTAVDRGLAHGITSVATVLGGLPTNDAVTSAALVGGRWFGANRDLGPADVPRPLVEMATSGVTATQRVVVNGQIYLVVGAPLRQSAGAGALFESFSLEDLDHTLRSMAGVLAMAAMVTTLLGVGIGRVASALALRPLVELTKVAGAVAGGRLDARLLGSDDPDLAPLAASFNDTVADLQHRVVADSRFAVDVSHELRTPLTTMLNSVQLIMNRKEQLPAEIREPVELLAGDLDRFRTLVVDLLEISRHDAGEDLVLEPADIGDLARRAADSATGRAVTSLDPGATGLVVRVDKRRLERVLTNLVTNAEVHGGGCTGVRVERQDGVVRILVDDSGPGIGEQDRVRLFDRFARSAGAREQGVGLGLAIVQRHVSAHGGAVRVESSPEGGARFVVELPVRG